MKRTLLTLSLTVLLGATSAATIGWNSFAVSAEGSKFTDYTWTEVHNSLTGVYTVSDDAIVGGASSTTDATLRTNFLIREAPEAIGDYSITAKAKGTMDYPNTRTVHIGIVPWYLNENNYLLAYMDWSPNERPNGMRELQITGRVDGKMPYVYQGGDAFVSSEWNDIWMVGANEGYAVPESSEITFTVTKTLSEEGDADQFSLYLNGDLMGFLFFRDTLRHENETARIGVYAFNDDVTFSSLEIENLGNPRRFHSVGSGKAKSGGLAWSEESGVYSVNAKGTESFDATTLVLHNDFTAGSYNASYRVALTGKDTEYGFGVLANFQDAYTYLFGVIEVRDGKTYAGFRGRIATAIAEELEQEEVESVQEISIDASSVELISVIKHGHIYDLYADGNLLATYRDSRLVKGGSFGATFFGAEASASSLSVEEAPYQEYDWYQRSIQGQNVYFSTRTNDASAVTYSALKGTFSFKSGSITEGDESKYASAYFSTPYYVEASAAIATTGEVKEGTSYGVYPWLEDAEHFVAVTATASGIEISYQFGSSAGKEVYGYPDGLTRECSSSETRALKASVSSGKVSVWFGSSLDSLQEIASNYEVEGIDDSVSPNVGVRVSGNPLTFAFTHDGFQAYQERIKGDWVTYGPRPDSWTFVGEDKILCSSEGGSSYMRDAAYRSTKGQADFYSGATFTISHCSGAEQKAALVPYWVNSNNYIIVMLSKWTANSAGTVVITGRLNGVVIGGTEWHEYTITYEFENGTTKLETRLNGDSLDVYVNGSSTPTIAATFPGIGDRDVSDSYSGFFYYNCDLVIENYKLVSEDRVYRYAEKPVIQVYGTPATTGTVGTPIALPVFAASSPSGEPVTAVKKVTDPNGQEVALTGSKFTPTTAGTYHVNVTCVDNWGNEADPIDYDIVVSEKKAEPEEQKKGCGGSVAVASALIGGISILGVALLAHKKKGN